MFLPHPRVKVSIVGSLRDREVACSASDRQGSNFEFCVWRTVSSQSSHHPQEVLLAQFSLYVHKGGLKPDSFHFLPLRGSSTQPITAAWVDYRWLDKYFDDHADQTRIQTRWGCSEARQISGWSQQTHEAWSQCRINAGPPSTTVTQHWFYIGWMPRVCWDHADVEGLLRSLRILSRTYVYCGNYQLEV